MSRHSLLRGSLLWSKPLAKEPETFTLSLSTDDCTEIDNALHTFNGLGLDGDKVFQAIFDLPKLKYRLYRMAEELHSGKGFFVISGLDLDKYCAGDISTIYLALASYIGDKRGIQNRRGEVLTHVIDSKEWKDTPVDKRHGIHSKKSLPFHNDMGSDILSLLAQECAVTGGGTYLASSWTVYNELAAREKSDALDTLLSKSWPIQVSGDNQFIECPLMKIYDNKLLTSVDPNRLGPHPNSKTAAQGDPKSPTEPKKSVPELTAEQKAALEALAESTANHEILVPLKKGDMLFLNNWAILHRRDSYEDSESTSRHLVRLWIRNTKLGWAVPKEMAEPWENTFERAGAKEVYNPVPPLELRVARYSAGSAAFVIDDGMEEEQEA